MSEILFPILYIPNPIDLIHGISMLTIEELTKEKGGIEFYKSFLIMNNDNNNTVTDPCTHPSPRHHAITMYRRQARGSIKNTLI